jgi:hypothetical protein
MMEIPLGCNVKLMDSPPMRIDGLSDGVRRVAAMSPQRSLKDR